jgi:hypothetical protein
MSAPVTQDMPYRHSDVPPPPAGPSGPEKPPHGHGRIWLIAAIVAALVMAAGGAAVAGIALTHSAPKPSAPTQNGPKAANPAPTKSVTVPAGPNGPTTAPAPDQYVQDIQNAGITATANSIDTIGRTLIADWQTGYTSTWTDANVLGPGGVYPYHYAIFDQITERDFGVSPPQEPVAPGPSDVDLVNQYLSDLNTGHYADAWHLGGDNLNGGSGYDTWAAGYSATSNMSWSAEDLGNGVVAVDLTANQTDGSTNTYIGTYTVSNGVIVSADLTQTS